MKEPRPSQEEYKMALAVEISSRSNCFKAIVGAILFYEGRTRAAGYNGTVEGYDDCFEGGCPRCKDPRVKRGEQLDRCICVHAEENALISAARHGIAVGDTECYVTHEPCLSCTKLLIQAHVKHVVYLFTYNHPIKKDHNKSRQQMRKQSKERGGTLFLRFDEVMKSKKALGLAKRWRKRSTKMREKAWAYAKAKGVIKAGARSPSE